MFSEYLIFWSETSTEQQLLENRKLFRAVTQLLFGIATFLAEELLRIKMSAEELLCRSRNNKVQHQLYQKSYIFEKVNFQKIKIPHFLLFLESFFLEKPLFQKALPSYLFKRATFSQQTFSEELLFCSYAFSPQLHLLFISK